MYTFGHGTLSADAFATIIGNAGIHRIVDVRSFPGSRRNPQFGREEMQRWVPEAAIGYVWMSDLGGRRRPTKDSKHVALRDKSFRAYADYMESDSFLTGVDDLLALADDDTTAVMCSESVWWRCHRRLLADYLVLVRQVEVLHLMHDGRLTAHPPTEGVRMADGAVVYDVGVTPPLPTI
ncbi:MAG: DUF488 domain-containing protein [Ilumatobacteraceae bacterium]